LDKLLERKCVKQTQTSFSYKRRTVYLYFEIFPKFNTALLNSNNKVFNTSLFFLDATKKLFQNYHIILSRYPARTLEDKTL
jgi:hypothetical protein